MSIPPLHHGILDPGIHGIGLEESHRHGKAVEYMQYCHRNDVGTEKPVGYINMFYPAPGNGAKIYIGIYHPDDCNQYINRPFQFGIFLGCCDTQGKRYRCRQDDNLPAPECKCSKPVIYQPYMAGPLNNIIGSCKQGAATKSENYGIGM